MITYINYFRMIILCKKYSPYQPNININYLLKYILPPNPDLVPNWTTMFLSIM